MKKYNVIQLQKFHPVHIFIKISAILKYFTFNRFYQVFTLCLAVFLLWFAGSQVEALWRSFLGEIKSNNTGSIFNLVTLIFILALWVSNIVKEWGESLEKYLSVRFFCGDKEFPELADSYALLISESDIRSLAQQVGQQKNNNIRLTLDSTEYEFEKTLSYDKRKKVSCSPFWHYEVKVSLRSPPSGERQYKSKEEYLEIISSNLKQLLEKTEKEFETELISELKNTLSEIKNAVQSTSVTK